MSRRGRRESLDTPHPSHSWLPVCLHRRPVLDISSPLVSLTIVRAHSSPSSLPTLDHAGRRTPRGLRYGLSNSYSSILAAFCPARLSTRLASLPPTGRRCVCGRSSRMRPSGKSNERRRGSLCRQLLHRFDLGLRLLLATQ